MLLYTWITWHCAHFCRVFTPGYIWSYIGLENSPGAGGVLYKYWEILWEFPLSIDFYSSALLSQLHSVEKCKRRYGRGIRRRKQQQKWKKVPQRSKLRSVGAHAKVVQQKSNRESTQGQTLHMLKGLTHPNQNDNASGSACSSWTWFGKGYLDYCTPIWCTPNRL